MFNCQTRCALSSPCKNGGRCVDDLLEDEDFRCECRPGFGGKTCETGERDWVRFASSIFPRRFVVSYEARGSSHNASNDSEARRGNGSLCVGFLSFWSFFGGRGGGFGEIRNRGGGKGFVDGRMLAVSLNW